MRTYARFSLLAAKRDRGIPRSTVDLSSSVRCCKCFSGRNPQIRLRLGKKKDSEKTKTARTTCKACICPAVCYILIRPTCSPSCSFDTPVEMRLLCLFFYRLWYSPMPPYYVRLCSSIFRLCSYMFQLCSSIFIKYCYRLDMVQKKLSVEAQFLQACMLCRRFFPVETFYKFGNFLTGFVGATPFWMHLVGATSFGSEATLDRGPPGTAWIVDYVYSLSCAFCIWL